MGRSMPQIVVVNPDSLPMRDKQAYWQGYADYKASPQRVGFALSHSSYSPTPECEPAYQSGWDRAADEFSKSVTRRSGGVAIVLGIVAIVPAVIVWILGDVLSSGGGVVTAYRWRASAAATGLLLFGITLLIRGLKAFITGREL